MWLRELSRVTASSVVVFCAVHHRRRGAGLLNNRWTAHIVLAEKPSCFPRDREPPVDKLADSVSEPGL